MYPAMLAVGSFTSIFTEIFASLARALVNLVSSFFGLLVGWAVIFTIAAVLFLMYEQNPSLMRSFAGQWDTWLGPLLQWTIVAPSQLLYAVIQHVLPVYNGLIGILFNTFRSVVITGFFQGGVHALDAGEALGTSGSRLAQSFSAFVSGVHERVNDCSAMGDRCFEPVMLDLVGPSVTLPGATRSIISLFLGMCPVVQAPFDLALYPFMDVNMYRGVHHLVNAVTLGVIETPRITTERCKRHKGESTMMCVPDVRRVFDEAVQGIRAFGVFFDNWLNMMLVIVEAALGGDPPECAMVERRESSLEVAQGVFGTNATVVAGISPTLFAVTDGTTIQYIDTGPVNGDVTSPLGEGWPIEVDVTLGVAVVALASGSDTAGAGTGLM
eukprot:880588-Rhodomonas_salina.1